MDLQLDADRLAADKTSITTIDAHTAGEPLRIITGGFPQPTGDTMLARRRDLLENHDQLRRAIMHEPRGHFDMYGALVTPPVSQDADIGVLFMHNEGYSTMCGHGIIALATVLVEGGMFSAEGGTAAIGIDTPAGLVRATAHVGETGRVEQVSFLNVPSFLYKRDLSAQVEGLGQVVFDVAFGGAFYAILPAGVVGLRVSPEHTRALVGVAAKLKRAINATVPIEHPHDGDLGFLYGVIFTDEPEDTAHHSRNLCVFANSEVDRSPTGTGVSARVALHHAKGEIAAGESIAVESVLGRDSVFVGRVADQTQVGEHTVVVPEVSGSACVTGVHRFLIDADDPLSSGFLIEAIADD